jgi:hypothetical protein
MQFINVGFYSGKRTPNLNQDRVFAFVGRVTDGYGERQQLETGYCQWPFVYQLAEYRHRFAKLREEEKKI